MINAPIELSTINARSCHQYATSNQPSIPTKYNAIVRGYAGKGFTPIAVESCADMRTIEANHLTYQSLVCSGVIFVKFIIKSFFSIVEGSANHFL